MEEKLARWRVSKNQKQNSNIEGDNNKENRGVVNKKPFCKNSFSCPPPGKGLLQKVNLIQALHSFLMFNFVVYSLAISCK